MTEEKDLGLYEILDRISIIQANFEDYILDASGLQGQSYLFDKAEAINKLLADFYQEVGVRMHRGTVTKARSHELKTWPEYYDSIASGEKKFEIRKNDRNFFVGDILTLKEWDPSTETYTGRQCDKKVDYILSSKRVGVREDYVVMSLSDP